MNYLKEFWHFNALKNNKFQIYIYHMDWGKKIFSDK